LSDLISQSLAQRKEASTFPVLMAMEPEKTFKIIAILLNDTSKTNPWIEYNRQEVLSKIENSIEGINFDVKARGFYKLAQFFFKITKKWEWYIDAVLNFIFDENSKNMDTNDKYALLNFLNELIKDLSDDGAAHTNIITIIYNRIESLKEQSKRDETEQGNFLLGRLRFFLYYYITYLLENRVDKIYDGTIRQRSNLNINILLKKGIQVPNLLYIYLELLIEFKDSKTVKEYLQQQSEVFDFRRCLKICSNIPDVKSFLLERTGEVSHALYEIIKEMEKRFKILQEKLNKELQRNVTTDFDHLFEKVKEDFNLITDDPPVFFPNEAIEDQQICLKENPKPEIPKVFYKDLQQESAYNKLVDVIACHEYEELKNELRVAINLCSQISKRKTLEDTMIYELWFTLLNVLLDRLKKLRYGYIHEKPLIEEQDYNTCNSFRKNSNNNEEDLLDYSSEEEDKVEDDSSEDESQDEYEDSDKNEVVALRKHVMEIQYDSSQSKLQTIKLKDVDQHLIENMEGRHSELDTAHNMPKLINIWLQRCTVHLIRLLLSTMTQYVDIPSIMDNILLKYSNNRFGDLSNVMRRILVQYGYNKTYLRYTNSMASSEVFSLLEKYHGMKTRGFTPKYMSFKTENGSTVTRKCSIENLPKNISQSNTLICLSSSEVEYKPQ
jgi:hypothetical protein